MEETKKELRNKIFLLKLPKETFEYIQNLSDNQVGNLTVLLNQKRKPEITVKFNKPNGPKTFSFISNKTNDFFYFYDQERKEDIKINNIDNFGKLIVKDENENDQLIENIYKRETNKSNEIQIKPVSNKEKKYKQHEEIKLTGKKYVDRNKKEKRVRKEKDEAIMLIKESLAKKKYATPKEIADEIDIPENQVKEILNEICERREDDKFKYYQLKDKIET
jgi:hypothetical protein